MTYQDGLVRKLNGQDDENGFSYHTGMPGTPKNPNTGIAGPSPALVTAAQDFAGQHFGSGPVGSAVQTGLQQMRGPALSAGQALSPEQSASIKGAFSDKTQPAPAAPDAPMPASPFESANTSVRGYLDEAMRAFAPKVKSIGDEAGRKSAVEGYLRELMPEVQKRGGSLSDIRGENATVDGRIIDFFRDIEGAADPQYLDKTDEVRGGGRPMGGGMAAGGSVAPLLQGDAQANVQAALSKFGQAQNSDFLQQLIAQLQGGA